MKALVLFSGGLDSMIAAKLLMEQGIDVIPVNFVSHFFGNDDKVKRAANALGLKLVTCDFSHRHMEMVKSPKYGYGRHVNPCTDCHGLMLNACNDLLDAYDAKFVATGEVLGQRPMSQTRAALAKVDKLSGIGAYTLRPLSAKLLPATAPEDLGWVDRSKLYDISGRRRERQFQIADYYGFSYVPTPGGGCLLTDPNYSAKLKSLLVEGMEDNLDLLRAIRHGRVFRNGDGVVIIVSRHDVESKTLMSYSNSAGMVIRDTPERPGPTVLVFTKTGAVSEDSVHMALMLFARYCCAKHKDDLPVIVNGEPSLTGAYMITDAEMKRYSAYAKMADKDMFKWKFKEGKKERKQDKQMLNNNLI